MNDEHDGAMKAGDAERETDLRLHGYTVSDARELADAAIDRIDGEIAAAADVRDQFIHRLAEVQRNIDQLTNRRHFIQQHIRALKSGVPVE